MNELGYANADYFGYTYAQVIDQIRALQPDANLYIQNIIPVNAQECAEHNQFDYVKNETIRLYNDVLIKVAAEKQVFLLNVAEALTDENGELPADISSDGVHFRKEGYVIWRDYLLCHTG